MRADLEDMRWEALLQKADKAFNAVAGLDGDGKDLSREDLVTAHGGERGLFNRLDTDASGTVTRREWHRWLRETHTAKGAKGEGWLHSILDTLLGFVKQRADTKKKARRIPSEPQPQSSLSR